MGVIKRQGIKQSLVVYLGTVIGMINVLFIYPAVFTQEELGLTRFLIDTAALISPFLLVGATNLTVRFFPEFRDPKSAHHGFLSLLITYTSIGVVLATVLYLFFRSPIEGYYGQRSELFEKYFYALWIITALYSYSTVLRQFTTNMKRIVVPTLLHDYSLKLGVPILGILYYLDGIDMDQLVVGIIGIFLLDLTFQLLYLARLRDLRFQPFGKLLTKERVGRMFSFAVFGLFGTVGSRIINFMDSFMVATLFSLEGLAVFYVAFVISNVLMVPFRAINSISGPIIADHWHSNNREGILDIYRRSSAVLLTSGLVIFLLIWTNIDHFYAIMPNGELYAAGKSVILILGIAKIIDLATGMNASIIGYSKYYKFNFYTMGVLAAANIGLNLLLIPRYGIEGAALATMISLGLFNLSRFIFIWWKFKMQPFNKNTLFLTLFGLSMIVAGAYLPSVFHPIADILWKSVLMGSISILVLWISNWSPDIKDLMKKGLLWIRH